MNFYPRRRSPIFSICLPLVPVCDFYSCHLVVLLASSCQPDHAPRSPMTLTPLAIPMAFNPPLTRQKPVHIPIRPIIWRNMAGLFTDVREDLRGQWAVAAQMLQCASCSGLYAKFRHPLSPSASGAWRTPAAPGEPCMHCPYSGKSVSACRAVFFAYTDYVYISF